MNFMKNILGVAVTVLMFACGSSHAFEGSYRGVSGKVGIYTMSTMTIKKNSDGSTYTVAFKGEESLTYDDATAQKGKIQISDKGFVFDIQFDGKKAIVDPTDGKAVFERVGK